MTAIRSRRNAFALLVAAAALTGCAAGPTAPDQGNMVTTDSDSTGRKPTMPWARIATTTPSAPGAASGAGVSQVR
jgi:hypothetical protein